MILVPEPAGVQAGSLKPVLCEALYRLKNLAAAGALCVCRGYWPHAVGIPVSTLAVHVDSAVCPLPVHTSAIGALDPRLSHYSSTLPCASSYSLTCTSFHMSLSRASSPGSSSSGSGYCSIVNIRKASIRRISRHWSMPHCSIVIVSVYYRQCPQQPWTPKAYLLYSAPIIRRLYSRSSGSG